jgi:hypothetical protein
METFLLLVLVVLLGLGIFWILRKNEQVSCCGHNHAIVPTTESKTTVNELMPEQKPVAELATVIAEVAETKAATLAPTVASKTVKPTKPKVSRPPVQQAKPRQEKQKPAAEKTKPQSTKTIAPVKKAPVKSTPRKNQPKQG